MSYRPGGVTALIVVFLIIAVLGGSSATLIGASYLTSITQSFRYFEYSSTLIYVVAIFILAEMYVFAAIGLFRMKNWGRILALILGTLMIIGGTISLIVIVGIIPLTLGIIVVVYLGRDVKYEFE